MSFPTVLVEIAFTNYTATTVTSAVSGEAFLEGFTEGFDAASSSASSTTIGVYDDPASTYDSGRVYGGDVWTDVTEWVEPGFSSRRGSNRAESPLLRYEAGTCTVTLDNSTRRFDPTNTAGPYVVDGVTQITPMRPVRISATWAGQSYEIFRGFTDSWNVDWFGSGYSTTTLTATDATKVLANIDRDALSYTVGEGETTDARVHRILDTIAWPDTERAVFPSATVVQGTSHDRSVWEEMLSVSDAELGEVYIDAGGRVVFRGRDASIVDIRSAYPQAVFGDGVGEIPFKETAISYDDAGLANVVRVARTGGIQQSVQDDASIGRNLTHTHNRTDLILNSDSDVAAYAQFLLYQSKDPELRYTTLTLIGHDDETALYPHMLGRQFGDRITITRRPPGGGTISRDCFVRGVSHNVTVNDWTTIFVLQSASKWSGFGIYNHPTQGVFDAGNAYA